MLMFLYYIGGQAARGRRQIRRVQGKHALPLFYTDVLSMCSFYTSVHCIQYPGVELLFVKLDTLATQEPEKCVCVCVCVGGGGDKKGHPPRWVTSMFLALSAPCFCST